MYNPTHFTSLFLASSLLIASASLSQAAAITLPPSLNPGDTYRIIFITSTKRDATSTNIADYNQFVTNAANLSPELQSLNTTWTALASTETTNVLDNTGLSSSDTQTRFFNTLGQLIATGVTGSNASLFGGANTQHGARIATEAGNFLSGPGNFGTAWTGTTDSGDTVSIAYLGATRVGLGNSSFQDRRWIALEPIVNTNQLSVYGISGLLTVPSEQIPEPATIGLLGSALLAIGFATSRRKRR